MTATWFLKKNGADFGPYTDQQIKQLADQGQIAPTDLVFWGAAQQWLPAYQIAGLLPEAGGYVASPSSESPPPPIEEAPRPWRFKRILLGIVGILFFVGTYFSFMHQRREFADRLQAAEQRDALWNKSAEQFGHSKKNEAVTIAPADHKLTYLLAGAGVVSWIAGLRVQRRK
jgi:hypothetical protein